MVGPSASQTVRFCTVYESYPLLAPVTQHNGKTFYTMAPHYIIILIPLDLV